MKKPGSKGLIGFWADIDDEHQLRFQEWHNCEHMSERVAVQGFNVGRRYRGMDGALSFFMCYETDDAAVLRSKAYLRALTTQHPGRGKLSPISVIWTGTCTRSRRKREHRRPRSRPICSSTDSTCPKAIAQTPRMPTWSGTGTPDCRASPRSRRSIVGGCAGWT
jgi:hypothetical protein